VTKPTPRQTKNQQKSSLNTATNTQVEQASSWRKKGNTRQTNVLLGAISKGAGAHKGIEVESKQRRDKARPSHSGGGAGVIGSSKHVTFDKTALSKPSSGWAGRGHQSVPEGRSKLVQSTASSSQAVQYGHTTTSKRVNKLKNTLKPKPKPTPALVTSQHCEDDDDLFGDHDKQNAYDFSECDTDSQGF
jgi:hypothetical protein